ncbi:hypothetical protein NOI24_16270 [Neorhizobium galegae]|uniref:hypothetical protein n=1 Tax=Neorhizobium galegae TaxID=399 RepID=UPI002106C7ED|nr:hypothetical protein [Neorhizobium galegae]MCQ1772866.1 hypothetical protein [Neorhizobium galegae]MCQ1799187.1 hypothetical protein [Neorhizobium galegae]
MRALLVPLLLAFLNMEASAQTTPAVNPPAAAPAGNSQTWYMENAEIKREDDIVAVYLRNATFTLFSSEDKQVFLLDFDHYNAWQEGGVMLEDLLIKVRVKNLGTFTLTKINYYSLMDHCYYGGRRYIVSERVAGPPLLNMLEDVYFEVEPVKSKIGEC